MSHVAAIAVKVRDLDALAACAPKLGMELVRNVDRYRWYGQHVGDYPLPAGFRAADLGKCTHVLRLKGNPLAYEVGVVARPDGSYALLWDFWQGGYGLQAAIGASGEKLVRGYALEAAKRAARRQGFQIVQEQTMPNGAVKLKVQA